MGVYVEQVFEYASKVIVVAAVVGNLQANIGIMRAVPDRAI
jgi:hypothetical protein